MESDDNRGVDPALMPAKAGAAANATANMVGVQSNGRLRHQCLWNRAKAAAGRGERLKPRILFKRPHLFMLLNAPLVEQFAQMRTHRLRSSRMQEFRHIGVNP